MKVAKLDARTVARLALPPGKSDEFFWDQSMPGFGLRLDARSGQLRKNYVVQYRRGPRSPRYPIGSAEVLNAEQARAQAKKVLAKVALGEDPAAERASRRERERFTFGALARDYLNAKQHTVRAKTFVEARRYVTGKYFRPLFSMAADHIARRDVAACLVRVSRESGIVTAKRARSELSSMYAWAMGQGLVESNPVIGTNKLKSPPSRDRVLDDRELAAVWRAAGDDEFGRIVRLLILTAQRRAEVGAMTWQELDPERGTWTIPAARAKNNREHVLGLPALAWSIIESVPRMASRDWLFGRRAGGFTSWALNKRMLDARLGDQVRPFKIHDLRRSTASGLARIGTQPHIIEVVLNHFGGFRSGVHGTYNRNPYFAEAKQALDVWANHIATIVAGGEQKVVHIRA